VYAWPCGYFQKQETMMSEPWKLLSWDWNRLGGVNVHLWPHDGAKLKQQVEQVLVELRAEVNRAYVVGAQTTALGNLQRQLATATADLATANTKVEAAEQAHTAALETGGDLAEAEAKLDQARAAHRRLTERIEKIGPAIESAESQHRTTYRTMLEAAAAEALKSRRARAAEAQEKIEKAIAQALGDHLVAFIVSARVCEELESPTYPRWVDRFNYPPKLQPPAAGAA
jgi:hypothetical protein